jgi:hypothetical protein
MGSRRRSDAIYCSRRCHDKASHDRNRVLHEACEWDADRLTRWLHAAALLVAVP